jgi:hypothetical protein
LLLLPAAWLFLLLLILWRLLLLLILLRCVQVIAMIKSSALCGSAIIAYLQAKGYPEVRTGPCQ